MDHQIPQVEEDHSLCEFGKWLLSANDELKRLPAFQALEAPHRELHLIYRLIKHTPDMGNLQQQKKQLSEISIRHINALEHTLQQGRPLPTALEARGG